MESQNSKIFPVAFHVSTSHHRASRQHGHLIFTSHHTQEWRIRRSLSTAFSQCSAIMGTPVLPRCTPSPGNTVFQSCQSGSFLVFDLRSNCVGSGSCVELCFHYKLKTEGLIIFFKLKKHL